MTIPSKKIQVNEIIKCGQDPVYFIDHYIKIQHPTRGLIPFETYEFQKQCVRDFLDHRFNIIKKSRQLGISTICSAYCLWLAIFYKDKNILVVATQLATAKNFITKVKTMFRSLPSWLVLPKLDQDSIQSLGFSNGSIIKASPTNQNVGRSEALSLLIIDEAAHIEKLDELWLGLFSCVSAGGRITLLSSPKGVGNQFHKIWDESEKGINDFHRIDLPWYVHPEKTPEWFAKETKNMDARAIAQELCGVFEASGHAFLTTEDIMWLGTMAAVPVDRGGPRMDIWIWKPPVPGRRYIVAADVSRGDGEDFSTYVIIDMQEDEIVCEYRGKIPPDRFAELLADIGRKYNNALICPELNTYGALCARRLKKDLKYENLFYEKKMGDSFGAYGYQAESDEDEILPGFTTTSKTRPLILGKLEELIRNKRIRSYSTRFHEELKTFVIAGGRPQAMRGYTDDLVMACAIGCWIYDVAEGHSKLSEGLNEGILSGLSRSSRTLNNGWTGFGNGGGLEMPIIPLSTTTNRHTKQLPPGVNRIALENYMAHSWLFDKIEKK